MKFNSYLLQVLIKVLTCYKNGKQKFFMATFWKTKKYFKPMS